jgi:hypothetical protein
MSWHKITLPLTMNIDPNVVEIGKLVTEVYERENRPEGFAMMHATRGSQGGLNDTRLVYLSPVASELSREVLAERWTLEPCDVPARDEPNAAWCFGDPYVRAELKEKWEPAETDWEFQAAHAAVN